jgi:hypothetical protein
MSEPVRVAFVMEGPTDYIALRAAVRALLVGREFVPTVIWPELDDNLAAQTGGGWGGVYKWCRQAVSQAEGPAGDNPVLGLHDMVVIQVDADVARKRYSDYSWIKDPPDDEILRGTCEKTCPPPHDTTAALRMVMLGWLGETSVPDGLVICTPSKSIETWVLVALFPDDRSAQAANIECRWDAEIRLRKHGLIKSGQKLIPEYAAREDGISAAWSEVRRRCGEAERFSIEFLAAIPSP